jgi:hypothetical protein
MKSIGSFIVTDDSNAMLLTEIGPLDARACPGDRAPANPRSVPIMGPLDALSRVKILTRRRDAPLHEVLTALRETAADGANSRHVSRDEHANLASNCRRRDPTPW